MILFNSFAALISIAIDIVIGIVVGFVATTMVGEDSSNMMMNCLIGFIGGIVGHLLFGFIGIYTNSIIGNLIFGIVGACAALWVYRKFIRK